MPSISAGAALDVFSRCRGNTAPPTDPRGELDARVVLDDAVPPALPDAPAPSGITTPPSPYDWAVPPDCTAAPMPPLCANGPDADPVPFDSAMPETSKSRTSNISGTTPAAEPVAEVRPMMALALSNSSVTSFDAFWYCR